MFLVSTYPYWSLSFPIRDDVDPVIVRVLQAVAADSIPEPVDLAALHPVPRYYLADWRRLLNGESEPFMGCPIRLSRDFLGRQQMSIEFSQHDNECADGGWIFCV